MVRGLSNTSELGLTCSCSLTSPSTVSELLHLLALGVTGAVGLVDGIGRVAGLGWFEFTCIGGFLEPCVILRIAWWSECVSHASSIHPCEAP